MADRIDKPRGTLDFIGDDKKAYDGLKAELSAAARRFGCQMIETPMFEEERLFVRGVGESSDIVTKEMFRLDVKGEHDYVLRPEFTAGVNRAAIENKLYASPDLPLRLFYCGPVFRFERPQKGRLRELNQFGVEFLDSKIDNQASIDCLLLFYRAAEEALGRELLLKLNFLGSFASRARYVQALKDYYAPRLDQMCEDCHHRFETNVLRILDCKVESDIEINKGAPLIGDFLSPEDQAALAGVEGVLKELNIPFVIDQKLVRGLDYYTGLVFELYDPMNLDLGAIGGGGQYGKLMAEIGGPDFEGIGFSYGFERMLLSLDQERKEALIKGEDTPIDCFVADVRSVKDSLPFLLEDELRSAGRNVTAASYQRGLGGALKMADRLHARFALIFADDNPGQVIIKDMKDRSQEMIKADDPDRIAEALIEKENRK
jgi:histidyl-tRNA synthetase